MRCQPQHPMGTQGIPTGASQPSPAGLYRCKKQLVILGWIVLFLLLPLPFLVVVKYLESVMVVSSQQHGPGREAEHRGSRLIMSLQGLLWRAPGRKKTKGGKEFGISWEESQEAQSLRKGEHLAAL